MFSHLHTLTQRRLAALAAWSSHTPSRSGVLSLLRTGELPRKRFHTLTRNTRCLWHAGPENRHGSQAPKPCPEHSDPCTLRDTA